MSNNGFVNHIRSELLFPYLTSVHYYVYTGIVKKRELQEKLRKFGWWFLRHGTRHDVWTNGENKIEIPRHREINEITAGNILKYARRRMT